MRTLIIIAVASTVALLSIAGTASASVNVTDNAGTIGKGDVQSLLSFNDARIQNAWSKGKVKFTSTFKTVKDTSWSCTDGTVKHHYFNTVSDNQVNAVAQTNKAGKLTSGWILDGSISAYGPTTGFTTGDDGTGRFATYSCAGHGSTVFSTMHVDQSHSVGGLQVNGIDLPNTQVEVAPVA